MMLVFSLHSFSSEGSEETKVMTAFLHNTRSKYGFSRTLVCFLAMSFHILLIPLSNCANVKVLAGAACGNGKL